MRLLMTHERPEEILATTVGTQTLITIDGVELWRN